MVLFPLALTLGGALASDEVASFLTSSDATQARLQRWGVWILVVGGFLSLMVGVMNVRRKRRVSTLRGDIARLQGEKAQLEAVVSEWEGAAQLLADGVLLTLAEGLDFKAGDHNLERVTIYCHDPAGYFVPFGRYSRNTRFNSKGRSHYPDDEGCIGKAWEHGRHFMNGFPDPTISGREYVELTREQGLTKRAAEGLTMRSRLYFGWRVRDTSDSESLAVVIVESLDPDRYTCDDLVAFFKSQDPFLRKFVELLQPRLPQLSKAAGAGL